MIRWCIRIALLLAAVAATWVVYSRRILISAWVWHLRHGTSLTVGNYVVPVPKNWYVQDWGPGNQFLFRLDTADMTRYRKLKEHAGVSVTQDPILTSDQIISSRMARTMDALKKEGVNPVLQRTFDISNGKMLCVGGYQPRNPGVFDVDPVAWSCNSYQLELRIVATDPDMEEVWKIIAGIRRRS